MAGVAVAVVAAAAVVVVGAAVAEGPRSAGGTPPANEAAGGVGASKGAVVAAVVAVAVVVVVGVAAVERSRAVGGTPPANEAAGGLGLWKGVGVAAAAAAAGAVAVAEVAVAARWCADGAARVASWESWMRRMASAMVIEVPLMLIMVGGVVPSAEEGVVGMVRERWFAGRVAMMGEIVVVGRGREQDEPWVVGRRSPPSLHVFIPCWRDRCKMGWCDTDDFGPCVAETRLVIPCWRDRCKLGWCDTDDFGPGVTETRLCWRDRCKMGWCDTDDFGPCVTVTRTGLCVIVTGLGGWRRARRWRDDDGNHGRQHPSRGRGDGKPVSLRMELHFLVWWG